MGEASIMNAWVRPAATSFPLLSLFEGVKMQVELAIHTADERSTHLVWTLPESLDDLTFGYLYNAVEDAIKLWLNETNVELPHIVDPGEVGYNCPVCTDPPRSFDTSQGLNMHLRRVHSKNGW